MPEIITVYEIVGEWMQSRDAIASRWRLQNTGFATVSQVQTGLNEFTASMDYRTKQLMTYVAREFGEGWPITLRSALGRKDSLWYGFRDAVAVTEGWTPLHSEGLYELVMNFDKFLTALP